jgi:hypothetical protein
MVRVVELLPLCALGFAITALFKPFVQGENSGDVRKQADGITRKVSIALPSLR